MTPDVKAVLDGYPAAARSRLTALRTLILDVAASIDGVGPLEETLKWSEPAYLTPKSRSGTTLRMAWKGQHPDHVSLFVNCQTSLIDTYRSLFPELDCHGNREVRLPLMDPLPDCLRECIALALTYKKPQLLEQRRRAG